MKAKKYSMKYYIKMLGQDYSNSMLRYLPDIEKYRLQTGELPFEFDGDMEYWDYYYFTEYSKRFGVYNSQFLTPPETAKKMVEVLESYFKYDCLSIFEPCCGSGIITRELQKLSYIIVGFDTDSKMIEYYKKIQTSNVLIEEYDFIYHDRDTYWLRDFQLLISNPPYEKLFEFFQYIDKHLALGAISVLLLPCNTFQKRQSKEFQSIIDRYSIIETVPNPYPFVNTKIQTSIFVLIKEK